MQKDVLCQNEPQFFHMIGSGILDEELQVRLDYNLKRCCSSV